MSKCDLRIEFDRKDRVYSSGETVAGTLFVRVNQNTQCNGLILEHYWQTHGRGNTDRGDVQTTILTQGQWTAGEEFEFAFSFIAPEGPPTYRGHYLNIDHYINARVDIPWAFDPQYQEEYILRPGQGSYGHAPSLEVGSGGLAGFFANAGIPVGVVLLLAALLLVFMFPFAIFLVPVAAVVLFFAYRNTIAERRIGTVKLTTGSASAAPGEKMPLQLDFVPRTSTSLNRITTKIQARESCTSGSGTRRTTHTHVLHERTFQLLGSQELVAGQPIQLKYSIPIPEIGAYSFQSSDNKLHWELETRIDIPRWPDWLDKRGILVRTRGDREVVEATVVEAALQEPPVIAEIKASDSGRIPIPAAVASAASTADAAVNAPEERGDGGDSTLAGAGQPELDRLLKKLAAVRGFGDDHQKHIDPYANRAFDCSLRVDRIDRTFGIIDDERYRGGRTILGTLEGSNCEAAVQMAASHNAQVDEIRPGQTLPLQAFLKKWDTLYRRINMSERLD